MRPISPRQATLHGFLRPAPRRHPRSLVAILPIFLALSALPALADERVLCTDSLQPGAPAFFQGGFAAGDEAAVRFTPPAGATLVKVQLLWGGSDIDGEGFTEGLKVYDDDGSDVFGFDESGWPGAVLADIDAPVLVSDSQASEVVLDTPIDLTTTGTFWVSLVFRHAGFPGVARDGGYDNLSAIFTTEAAGTGWYDNEFLLVDGDWIIRAVVDTDVPLNDAACRFEVPASEGEGEGEGDVGEGEGEGDAGEGEGDTGGEGEGEGDTGGEGEGEGDTGGEGEGEGDAGGEGEGEGEGEVGGEGEAEGLFVTSVTPSSADFGESVDLVVLGGGFVDGVAVRIGSEDVEGVVVDSDSVIRGQSPASLGVGSYDVIVQDGPDVFTFPSGFTVLPVDPVGEGEGEGEGEAPGGCGCGAVDASGSALGLLLLLRRRRRR
jgi:hypothetical protein